MSKLRPIARPASPLAAFVGLAALVLGLAACERRPEVATDTTATGEVVPPATPAPSGQVPRADTADAHLTTMSDASLVSVLETANAGEVEYSQAAVDRASNPQVREFARLMVREHGRMRDSVGAVARRLGVAAAAPDRVREMREELSKDLADLRAKTGEDFDEEFMAEQVDMHQETLDLLDDLDDDTNTPALKQAIEGAKASVRAHLDRAKQVKDELNR
jgi:putative membrane protein